MTLSQYLSRADDTVDGLARKVGVARWTIIRYAEKGRIPRPDVMARLVAATKGAVTPDDFYPIRRRKTT